VKLGKVLAALGRGGEADAAFEASFRLTPHRQALVRGLEQQRQGNLKEAEKIFREVLVESPDDVDALRLLGGVAMQARQWGDAEAILRRVVELAPEFYRAWMDLGLAQQEQDHLPDAERSFRRALRLEPRSAQPYVALGTNMAMAGRHALAEDAFKKALTREPRNVNALTGLGHVLKTVGEQERAIAAYRDCVGHSPGHGEAWWSLANLKTFRFTDAEVATMREQLLSDRLADEPRVNMLFAMATALEDRGEFAAAFEHYRQGNALRRKRESYDPVQTQEIHDALIEVFNSELLRSNGGGHPGDAPIFIVGLPRSGSTLIEQILASHSQVEGTAELPDVGRVIGGLSARPPGETYPEAARRLDASGWRELGESYLERTRRHRSGLPFFTDKNPNNFPSVGLIHLMLPQAKIIDARRHPLDSSFGSFKQHFAHGQTFSYDLVEIGEYFLEYRRMLRHWQAVLPGRVLEVRYEDLVRDQEGQTRRLLAHCELPWEDACLRFYETERPVRTASSEQVRQPIYSSSVNHWRHFRQELAPLIEILGEELNGWDR